MKDRLFNKNDLTHLAINTILIITLIVSISTEWYHITKCISQGPISVCVSQWQNPKIVTDAKITKKIDASKGLSSFSLFVVLGITFLVVLKICLKKIKKDLYKTFKKISNYLNLALYLLLVIMISASCFSFAGVNRLYCADGDQDPKETYICDNFSGKQTIIQDTIKEEYQWGPNAGFIFSCLSTVIVTGYFIYINVMWWRNRKSSSSSSSSSSSYSHPSSSHTDGYSKVGQESLISHNPDDYNLANEI